MADRLLTAGCGCEPPVGDRERHAGVHRRPTNLVDILAINTNRTEVGFTPDPFKIRSCYAGPDEILAGREWNSAKLAIYMVLASTERNVQSGIEYDQPL